MPFNHFLRETEKLKNNILSLSDIYFTIKAGLRVGRSLNEFIYLFDNVDMSNPDLVQHIALDSKKYYRSSVIRDNELEMAIITWRVGQESGLHGHPGDCIFKLLRGTLYEEIYSKKRIKKNLINQGDTGYINNNIGYHNVKNTGDTYAVSIHVYSPSFESQSFS